MIGFSKIRFAEGSVKGKVSVSPPNFKFDEQIFLGMISFRDPPKKGVPETI